MISKNNEKTKAVNLRRQGLSYTQILEQVPVAKSTLSLWLREVGLSKPQKQKLTERRLTAARRGGLRKRQIRIEKTITIKNAARKEVLKLIKDLFWLAGVLLYWAEGSKQKEWEPSQKVVFTNMDPSMLKLFQRWVRAYFVDMQLRYEIYIHKNADSGKACVYWGKILHVETKDFSVYYKNHPLKTYRKNIGAEYHGLVRIWIPKSTDMNRKIAGWTEGVIEYLQ